MLGIYAGLLHLRRPDIDAAMMQMVIRNLHRLVGPLPDVVALLCGLTNHQIFPLDEDLARLSALPEALAGPPMLRESWQHIQESLHERELSQRSNRTLSLRIAAQAVPGWPWLTWESRLRSQVHSGTVVSATRILSRTKTQRELFMGEVRPIYQEEKVTAVPQGQSVSANVAERIPKRKLPWPPTEGAVREARPDSLVIQKLADRLTGDPLHFTRSLRKLNNMELAFIYWLCPNLDPRIKGWTSRDSSIIGRLQSKSRNRAGEGLRQIPRALGVSVSAAVQIARQIIDKLFVRPYLPTRLVLRKYAAQVAATFPEYPQLFAVAEGITLPIQQEDTGRTLRAVELLYLIAENVNSTGNVLERFSLIAEKLNNIGFGWENTRQSLAGITVHDVTMALMNFIVREHGELAQAVARYSSQFTNEPDDGHARSKSEA